MKILISVFSPPSGTVEPLTKILALGSATLKGRDVIFCTPDNVKCNIEPASYISGKLSKTPMVTTFSNPMLEGKKTFFNNLATKRINKILRLY